ERATQTDLQKDTEGRQENGGDKANDVHVCTPDWLKTSAQTKRTVLVLTVALTAWFRRGRVKRIVNTDPGGSGSVVAAPAIAPPTVIPAAQHGWRCPCRPACRRHECRRLDQPTGVAGLPCWSGGAGHTRSSPRYGKSTGRAASGPAPPRPPAPQPTSGHAAGSVRRRSASCPYVLGVDAA